MKPIRPDYFILLNDDCVEIYRVAHVVIGSYVRVKGKRVCIEGWEDLDLFIHRDIEDPKLWRISEGKTGLSLGRDSFTAQSEAKEDAKQYLDFIRPKDRHPRTVISRKVLAGVISPRYKP